MRKPFGSHVEKSICWTMMRLGLLRISLVTKLFYSQVAANEATHKNLETGAELF